MCAPKCAPRNVRPEMCARNVRPRIFHQERPFPATPSGEAAQRKFSEGYRVRPCAMNSTTLGAMVVGVVALSGCEMLKAPPVPPFETHIRATGDPGEPLANVEFVYRDKVRGTTDASGVVKLILKGGEGSNYDFHVRCPKG